jgi:hypothetical protein
MNQQEHKTALYQATAYYQVLNDNDYYSVENLNYLDINTIESFYIDKSRLHFSIKIHEQEFNLNFDAKELLEFLNKNTILEIKEKLKKEIDNL